MTKWKNALVGIVENQLHFLGKGEERKKKTQEAECFREMKRAKKVLQFSELGRESRFCLTKSNVGLCMQNKIIH